MIIFMADKPRVNQVVVISRVKSRNAYQHVSDFDKGRIVVNRDCGLSFRSIAARVGQDKMTVNRIRNRWVQAVVRNALLDLNGLLSLAAEKTGMLPVWP
ncbi:hypothetical protein TNCV_5064891 [Trichonephila clavipes]|nr:hypothetical protein TNCV_5064891 [Trichonephila clavipes]